MHARSWVGAVLIAAISIACSGDDAADNDAPPCHRLRDHLVDLRTKGTKSIDPDGFRAALRRSMGDDYLRACEQLTSAQVDCALAATDPAAAAACASTPIATVTP